MNIPAPLRVTSRKILLAAKTRLTLLFIILVFVSACASTQSDVSGEKSQSRKAAESNTALGLEYMNRGQYEVALGKLKKAVKADPGYAPGQTVLAALYERIGEMDLAGKHYHKAYEADPTNGDVNNNYGMYLCRTGKEDKGIEHSLAALDDPFYSSPEIALANAGSCALDKGDIVAADDYLRRALKIDHELSDALITMAWLNYKQRDYLKSRAFMQRYEAVASHDAASLLLAYKIEADSGDAKAAKKYKLTLESTFPKSDQAAEARRLSGK